MESMFLFDTHSHAHDDHNHLEVIPQLDVDKIVLMGTSQNDWYLSIPPLIFEIELKFQKSDEIEFELTN
jgi:hypothetical protein